MKTRFLLTLLSLSVLGAPSQSQQGPRKGDLSGLQGKWVMWHDSEDFLVFEIKNNNFTHLRHLANGTEVTWHGSFTLNETTKPKQMTLVEVKNSAGEDLQDNLCIYELQGDRLLVIGGGPEVRPLRFYSGGQGKGHKTGIYQREKTRDLIMQ